jgi:hypothetical protein
MMRTFAVIALLACANAKPQDDVAKKFEALGNATKAVAAGWKNKTEAQNPKLPVDKLKTIPKHIKNRNAIPEVKSVIVVNSLGGCGRKLNAKKMGLKKSNKAAKLWKNSLLQVSHSGSFRGKARAPEHPGRESFSVPGAGADQTLKDEGRSLTGSVGGEEPYVTVLKDGWFEVGCYFDRMLTAGDKFGNDADQYKMGATESVNVSIALYDELILDEDKESMTPTVCFEFCRTLPDMVYFGIANGGYCYCAPYYHPKPGDESKCDSPCPGDNTVVCGNMKGKSSMFEMHLCDDVAEDLATAMGAAKDALDYYMETALFAKELGEKMTASGQALQTIGGLSGAPGAADNGQKAMVASKALTQGFMGESETYEKCLAAYELGKDYEGKDFTSSGNAIAAEHATKDMKGTVGGVVTGATATHDAIIAAYPAFDQVVFGDEPDGGDAAAMKLKPLIDGDEQKEADFRVASYAFDTTYEPAHSSCTGVSTGAPMMGLGKDGCALACEATVYPDVCVGFSFYTLTGADDICFMFADIETVETFTGPEALLQTNGKKADPDPAAAFCGIKMSLMSTGYKPKGEWKKTSRDFGSGSMSIKEDLTEYAAPSMGDLTMGAVTLKAAP